MYAALLKLIPFRDYVYAALALAAIVWFLHHDHVERDIGAARVTAAVREATAKAEKAAQAKVDKLNAAHADDVAHIEDRYEKAIRANDAAHAADLQRLRDRAASDARANKLLGGPASGAAAGEARASGPESLGSVPAELGLEIVDALRADDAALDKCWAERDSLTGK